MGVAEGDRSAFSIAQALIQGPQTDFSLRQVPRLDPERADDVPCRVACVSRPVPGWIRSYLLCPQRPAPDPKGGVGGAQQRKSGRLGLACVAQSFVTASSS